MGPDGTDLAGWEAKPEGETPVFGSHLAATPAMAKQTACSLSHAGIILFSRYYIHTQQMVTMVMMHFEQMFNSSQGKCSIAFIILSLSFFPAQGVCVCERERERKEGKGEGRKEGRREGRRKVGKRCLRYFQNQPEDIAWNRT